MSRMTGFPPPSPAVKALPVVLDSNVWLDILVFDDPHTRPIRAGLESGGNSKLSERAIRNFWHAYREDMEI